MNIKISKSAGSSYSNAGSSGKMVDYLEHENQDKKPLDREWFFSDDKNHVAAAQVIDKLDNNKKSLGKDDAKFFHIAISPSEKELQHIGSDPQQLRTYVRNVMDEYAKNFGKGLKGEDLMYYAKVHHTRAYKGTDPEVLQGKAKSGELKAGDQRHVHVLVSRKTKNNKLKISPLTNHRKTNKGQVKGGFDRDNFVQSSENKFDKMFNYQRERSESYEHHKIMKNGTKTEQANEKKLIQEIKLSESVEKNNKKGFFKRF